jgi:hypothetical protein
MALPVKTESSLHLRAAGESTSSLRFLVAAGDACCAWLCGGGSLPLPCFFKGRYGGRPGEMVLDCQSVEAAALAFAAVDTTTDDSGGWQAVCGEAGNPGWSAGAAAASLLLLMTITTSRQRTHVYMRIFSSLWKEAGRRALAEKTINRQAGTALSFFALEPHSTVLQSLLPSCH